MYCGDVNVYLELNKALHPCEFDARAAYSVEAVWGAYARRWHLRSDYDDPHEKRRLHSMR